MKLLCLISPLFIFIFLLTSCSVNSEQSQNEPFQSTTAFINSEVRPLQTVDEVLDNDSERTQIYEVNRKILEAAQGQSINLNIACDNQYSIVVDAIVDVSNIHHVDSYEYQIAPLCDSQRIALFEEFFGDKASKVTHNTYMFNDFWEIAGFKSEVDYHTFNVQYDNSGPGIANEKIFNLLNRGYYLEEFDSNQLDSLDKVNLESSLDVILPNCKRIISSITDGESYCLDYIRPFGKEGNRPFYWIVFSRSIDGMPVTAYRDLKFYVDENGIEYFGGALYNIGPSNISSAILPIEDAVDVLQLQLSQYLDVDNLGIDDFFSSEIRISKINLEYLVINDAVNGPTITPIWRFQLGETESSRNILRDRVIAVNAISGNLIVERRRNTF